MSDGPGWQPLLLLTAATDSDLSFVLMHMTHEDIKSVD